MWGIEFVTDRASKAPAKEQTAAIAKHCYEHGLVTVTAGTLGNVVRTLMPLVISDAELNEGLDILGAAIASAAA
jgi:4-aminobutyrate aminotransferase/(S)-3-amino-2-methylpropionate transaminase